MADVIGTPALRAEFDSTQLLKGARDASAKLKTTFEESNRAVEAQQRNASRRIQGLISQINADKPRRAMFELGQAIQHMGGLSKLSEDQVGRLRREVERLTAAGAKAPKSLASLVPSGGVGIGASVQAQLTSTLSAGAPSGLAGVLGAMGPAGLAAAAGIGAVTLAAGAAAREIAELGAQAEQWTNLAQSTGFGVVQVQQLSTLLEDAGIGADALPRAMKALHAEVARGAGDLQKFGIGIADIVDLAPEEQFRRIAERIAAIADENTRGAAAQAAFGRAGEEMIPVLAAVASGADKMFEAFSDEQVGKLTRADAALDKLTRTWKHLKGEAAILILEFGQNLKDALTGQLVGRALGGAVKAAEGISLEQLAKLNARAGTVDLSPLSLGPETPEQRAAVARFKEQLQEGKKAAEELLAIRRKYNELQVSIVKHTADEVGLMHDLDEQSKLLLANQQKIETGRLSALKGTRLRAGDMLPSVGGAGLWTRFQDVIDQEMKNAAAKAGKTAEEIAAAAAKTETALSGLTSGLALLGGALGGVWDRVLQTISNIKDSFKGWSTMSGHGKFNAIAGAAGQLGGLVGGTGGSALAGAAGGAMAGAAIGSLAGPLGTVIGGVIGGVAGAVGGFLKGRSAKKLAEEAKKVGEFLGGTVSAEQLKAMKEEAKTAGIDFQTYLKERKKEIERQAAIEKRQKIETGLSAAKGFAESIMDRMAAAGGSLSGALSDALNAIIGKVSEALLKTGLGILDARLKESKEFQAAQGLAGEVAGAIAGMREAGFVDEGLLAAGGAAAAEIQAQAIAAARAAGMPEAEAQKAGSAAIAGLLREQLNASLQSGKALDENTKKLLEEAKANGIEILADPAIEQLEVSRQQLDTLKVIAGQRAPGGKPAGAARGLGPLMTRDVGGGLGPLIQTHPRELVWVVPRHMMRGGIISAARGIFDEQHGRDGGGPPGPGEHRDGPGRGGGGGGDGGGGDGGAGGGGGEAPAPEVIRQAVIAGLRAAPRLSVSSQTTIINDNDPFATKERREDADRAFAAMFHERARRRDTQLLADVRYLLGGRL